MLKIKVSFKIFLITLIVIATTTIATNLLTLKVSQADTWKKAVVKLYSSGQVVGTWEALDVGTVEGDSLVFTIDRGKTVRISGTYSVETIK